MVQTPSDGTTQPIENSPPGIHTMPSGAGPRAGVLFGTVGAKGDAAGADGSAAVTPASADREGAKARQAATPARVPASAAVIRVCVRVIFVIRLCEFLVCVSSLVFRHRFSFASASACNHASNRAGCLLPFGPIRGRGPTGRHGRQREVDGNEFYDGCFHGLFWLRVRMVQG